MSSFPFCKPRLRFSNKSVRQVVVVGNKPYSEVMKAILAIIISLPIVAVIVMAVLLGGEDK